MQIFVSTHRFVQPKFLALFVLAFALAACQPAPATQIPATATASPSLPPTAAPSPTVAQPTAASTESTGAQAEQPKSAPELLKESAITYPTRLVWSLDGKRLAVFGEGSLTLLNAETFELIAVRSILSPARALDFSPDGRTLAFTPDGLTIELDDLDTGQVIQTITPDAGFQQAFFSPDGRWLAVDSLDQMAFTLWDPNTGQKGATLSGFVTAAPIYSARFSTSGNKLVWFARASIQVQDIQSGLLAAHIGHEDFITSFALNPDDSLLVTSTGGTYNGEYTPLIYFWNPASGEQIAVYPQVQTANALAFSPDGGTLAAAIAADVLLIDPANGQAWQTFHAADDAVTALCFSPDGSRMATAGSDGHVRLWRLK